VFRVPRSSDLRVWDRGGKPLYGSTCFNFPPCFGCSFLYMGPTFANVCLCWFRFWGNCFLSIFPSGPPGSLDLWSSCLSGPLVLLTLQLSWPSGGPPGPLAALLALWLTGPLALLPSGVRALLWTCVPCFGSLCLALGHCALLWVIAPCFGRLCLASDLRALPVAFLRRKFRDVFFLRFRSRLA
jgi:hypothetical protein